MGNNYITALIVVYNKNIQDSITCKRIRNLGEIVILIIDNSDDRNAIICNKEFCEKNSIDYISMDGNKGLSKAYNTAINYLKNKTEVLVLLDDDTDVPEEYFVKLKKCLKEQEDVNIFAPVIKGQDGVIYSPNNYCFLKNNLVLDPFTEIIQNRFNAISSCLAIRMNVFENYRYNEKLFVDEIDHCFLREQRALNNKFGIVDVEIVQNFHQRGKIDDCQKMWKRVRIRIIDIFRHARIIMKKKYLIMAYVKCIGIGFQMSKNTKSISFAFKVIALSTKLLFADV